MVLLPLGLSEFLASFPLLINHVLTFGSMPSPAEASVSHHPSPNGS